MPHLNTHELRDHVALEPANLITEDNIKYLCLSIMPHQGCLAGVVVDILVVDQETVQVVAEGHGRVESLAYLLLCTLINWQRLK